MYYPLSWGDDCWIGAQVLTLLGVKIGQGTFFVMNSLVNKDSKPNCMYTGVLAARVR